MFEHHLALASRSVDDTHSVAAALARQAREGDIIVLAGEMGSGKTAFAQGFGRALGVEEPITSPTFTLVHSYPIERPAAVAGGHHKRITLHHADLYRLERTAEVLDLALGELAEFHGIVLVEWGDVVEGLFGDHLAVALAPVDDDAADEATDDPDAVAAGAAADVSTAESDEPGADDVLALDTRRRIDIVATGSGWAARWSRLADDLEEFRC